MNSNRQKEIDSLKAKLAKLEAQQEKEQQERLVLEKAFEALNNNLQEAELSFDTFVRCYYKEIRKVVNKIEKEASKESEIASPKPTTKKRVAKKKTARRQSKAKAVIKIPAGTYGNIPSAPDQTFKVAEKGPRPKLLKSYAEKVGLDEFMANCRID